MKWRCCLILLLSNLIALQAQNIELGNVRKEELIEKRHPTDTSAIAAILFKKAKTTFKYSDKKGFESFTEFNVKVKIYKTGGLYLGDFKIPFYTGYEKIADDVLTISKAYTYNFENGKIEKTKVSSDGKYETVQNELWKIKSIAFPNVKVGSIIELRYILKSENISILPDFQYQYAIPVNFAEYTTEIPNFFLYKAIRNGYVMVDMKEKAEFASQDYDEGVGPGRIPRTLSYNQIKTTYTAANIPALIEEEYVDNIENYYAKLEHELQTVQYPDEKPRQMSTTWENVAKSIYQDEDFGAELEKFSYFIEDLKIVLDKTQDDQQKLTKTFNFVKNRMNWNGYYGYHTKDKLEKAYQEKTGNVAEINLIMVAMLRMAGLKANPVLISTRNNGIALFPNRSKFNYVIAGVNLDGKTVLLDATSKNTLPGILPVRDLNWVGRMIQKDGSSQEINLMPEHLSAKTTNLIWSIDAQGLVKGQVREQHNDYNGFVFREKYGNLANVAQIERLERKHKGIEIEKLVIQNEADFEKPLVVNYEFSNDNAIERIGDKMYFSPLLFFALDSNPFVQEKRLYPVDFAYANQDKYLINIKIPDGFEVASLPKSAAFTISQGLCNFKYNITQNNNTIQVALNVDINTAIIHSDHYEELKAFFSEVVKKENEKIVLKKI